MGSTALLFRAPPGDLKTSAPPLSKLRVEVMFRADPSARDWNIASSVEMNYTEPERTSQVNLKLRHAFLHSIDFQQNFAGEPEAKLTNSFKPYLFLNETRVALRIRKVTHGIVAFTLYISQNILLPQK